MKSNHRYHRLIDSPSRLWSTPAGLSDKERAAFNSLDTFCKKYRAYAAMMGTRPQTIGYALTDTPAGVAAWMYDYNNGEPERLLAAWQQPELFAAELRAAFRTLRSAHTLIKERTQ